MRLQTIGETIRRIDELSKRNLLAHYPEIPWRHVIGLRNIISREYLAIDPEEIFKIVKQHLAPLHEVILKMIKDLEAAKESGADR